MKRTMLLVPTCVLLLSACGTTTVDPNSEVNLVRKGLAATTAGPSRSIHCPSGVAMKLGATAICHVKLASGGSATITMKVDRVSSDGGHLIIVKATQP